MSPTYMLPGSFQEEDARKHYKIAADKTILLSPINWLSTGKQEEEVEMRKAAKDEIDIINRDAIDVTIDGKQMRDSCERIDTPLFRLPDRQYAVSDGYWLFLRLEKGEHMVDTFGSCRAGQVKRRMGYDLEII